MPFGWPSDEMAPCVSPTVGPASLKSSGRAFLSHSTGCCHSTRGQVSDSTWCGTSWRATRAGSRWRTLPKAEHCSKYPYLLAADEVSAAAPCDRGVVVRPYEVPASAPHDHVEVGALVWYRTAPKVVCGN